MAPRSVAPDQLLRGRYSYFRIPEVSERLGIISKAIFADRPTYASSLLQPNLFLCSAHRPYRARLDRRTGNICSGALPTIDGSAARVVPGMAVNGKGFGASDTSRPDRGRITPAFAPQFRATSLSDTLYNEVLFQPDGVFGYARVALPK